LIDDFPDNPAKQSDCNDSFVGGTTTFPVFDFSEREPTGNLISFPSRSSGGSPEPPPVDELLKDLITEKHIEFLGGWMRVGSSTSPFPGRQSGFLWKGFSLVPG